MRVDSPRVTFGPDKVTITGTAAFTEATRQRRIRVTIPHGPAHLPPPPATLQHLGTDGSPAAKYVVQFQSRLFRRVELEEASERGVSRFELIRHGCACIRGTGADIVERRGVPRGRHRVDLDDGPAAHRRVGRRAEQHLERRGAARRDGGELHALGRPARVGDLAAARDRPRRSPGRRFDVRSARRPPPGLRDLLRIDPARRPRGAAQPRPCVRARAGPRIQPAAQLAEVSGDTARSEPSRRAVVDELSRALPRRNGAVLVEVPVCVRRAGARAPAPRLLQPGDHGRRGLPWGRRARPRAELVGRPPGSGAAAEAEMRAGSLVRGADHRRGRRSRPRPRRVATCHR